MSAMSDQTPDADATPVPSLPPYSATGYFPPATFPAPLPPPALPPPTLPALPTIFPQVNFAVRPEVMPHPPFAPTATGWAPPLVEQGPRPHPHLTQAQLYISGVRQDIPEDNLAEVLRECLPVRIKLPPAVPAAQRLLPNAHYNWMTRHGVIEFDSMEHAEKALTCLLMHPWINNNNITVSPYQPPHLLPPAACAPRYIRPVTLMTDLRGRTDLRYVCPTPGEVWQAVRPWGSLRSIMVWIDNTAPHEQNMGKHWRAKVEFWYEEDAKHFDTGFGATGALLKGWQIGIIKDPTYTFTPPALLPPILPHDVSMRSNSSGRRRTWSANLVEVPGAGVKAVGIVADDGLTIQHGPGQHIQPAPAFGPGSSSASGLVDYSNVFVKHLDADISSFYLLELFQKLGRVVSARVMRDDHGRSRGYGFVSFETPEEAANAIRHMHGKTVGNQQIAVTLHEPRKVRPEKIAERQAAGTAVNYGRRATSGRLTPPRTDRQKSFKPNKAGTDDIRSLSPDSRKAELVRRVRGRVQAYARSHGVPEGYVEPTVKALGDHDLALIPLLHDGAQLEAKIAETFNVLQSDPDLDINMGLRRPGARPSPEELTSTLTARLRHEVERIDPLNVDTVLAIMEKHFQPGDLARCVEIKAALLDAYNRAKNELVQQLQLNETTNDEDSDAEGESELASSADEGESDDSIEADTTAPALSNLSLVDLAKLPAPQARAYLESPSADDLARLCLERPSQAALEWVVRSNDKSALERKSEMVAQLTGMLESSSLKKSAKLKAARDVVNGEVDDKALYSLMLYPPLMKAKVQLMLKTA
ncbi:hypothetical protein Q5752_001495 [Cryptotrichosporon argae]